MGAAWLLLACGGHVRDDSADAGAFAGRGGDGGSAASTGSGGASGAVGGSGGFAGTTGGQAGSLGTGGYGQAGMGGYGQAGYGQAGYAVDAGAGYPSRCDGHYVVALGTCSTVDDFEDIAPGQAPGLLPPGDGRNGSWSLPDTEMKPGSMVSVFAVAEPVVPDNPGLSSSTRVLHFHVSGAIDWGGDIGLALGPCYDVSGGQYGGIRFWARAAAKADIWVGVHTADTHGSYDCPPPGGDITRCWGAYRSAVVLDTSWRQYAFTWKELQQPSWALQVPFNPRKLVSMVWSTKDANPVDVWIDDVGFLGGVDGRCK